MNMTNQVQKIYQDLLKATKSKEVIKGSMKAMLKMYQQDNLPKEDIMEIQKILKQIS